MAKVPSPRRPGQTGGNPRGNIGTFRGAGGRVPPPPNRPTVSGKGGWGCPLSVLAPAVVLAALIAAVCHLG